MKRIFILAVAVLTAGSVGAQEDLSKQLEVTREYTPRVGQAAKLPIAPDMTDTVRLRPEISYRITSIASATSFRTRPYQPASVGTAPVGGQSPFYLRAAVGAPFVTEADLYFTPQLRAGRTFGLFANHSGSYSKIVNDLGFEADAAEMTNGAGVWGARQWKRYSLEGDIAYDNRRYNPYGVSDITYREMMDIISLQNRNFVYDKQMHRFSLGLVRAGLSFGDNFSDLSRFNFRVGVDGGYARFAKGDHQTNFDARVTMAKMFGEGRHGFELVMAGNGAFVAAQPGLARDNAIIATFAPGYLFSSGNMSLRAGIDVRYIVNDLHDQNRGVIAPSFEVRANLAGGAFVPFASYTSQILEGDREALSRRNPYVVTSGRTAWVNDARIGFAGDLNDIFSYKISGGMSLLNDYQIFVGTQLATPRAADPDGVAGIDYPPMWFSPTEVDGERFTVGAEIALHNLGGFGARLYGNWNKFSFPKFEDESFHPVGDLPRYDAGVELSYGYKGVFSIKFGAEFIGERDYLVRGNQSLIGPPPSYTKGTIAPVIDLTFGAEVRVAPDFWVFLEGENLADQVLYPYPHYRGLGASVSGGIKVVF